jgi:hypothetical protein
MISRFANGLLQNIKRGSKLAVSNRFGFVIVASLEGLTIFKQTDVLPYVQDVDNQDDLACDKIKPLLSSAIHVDAPKDLDAFHHIALSPYDDFEFLTMVICRL